MSWLVESIDLIHEHWRHQGCGPVHIPRWGVLWAVHALRSGWPWKCGRRRRMIVFVCCGVFVPVDVRASKDPRGRRPHERKRLWRWVLGRGTRCCLFSFVPPTFVRPCPVPKIQQRTVVVAAAAAVAGAWSDHRRFWKGARCRVSIVGFVLVAVVAGLG